MKQRSDAELFEEVVRHYSKGSMACASCGRTDGVTIDHVTPRSASDSYKPAEDIGRTLWARLKRDSFPPGYQVLCRVCNSSKGGKRWNERGAAWIVVPFANNLYLLGLHDGLAAYKARFEVETGKRLPMGPIRFKIDPPQSLDETKPHLTRIPEFDTTCRPAFSVPLMESADVPLRQSHGIVRQTTFVELMRLFYDAVFRESAYNTRQPLVWAGRRVISKELVAFSLIDGNSEWERRFRVYALRAISTEQEEPLRPVQDVTARG